MTRIYASVLAVALTGTGAWAQQNVQGGHLPALKQKQQVISRSTPTPASGDRQVIWSDDFSNAATWANQMAPGSFNLPWQIGVGLTNQGSYPTDPIESTTAANGYAMYDSDAGNNPGTLEENAYLTTANAIDLSAYPNVVLEFENQYRRFNPNRCFVVVSNDGTWPVLTDATDISVLPNVWELFTDVAVNASSANPEKVSINISAVAGSQANVKIRFHWTGSYGYTWFVDDVNIIEQPQYEMIMDYGVVSHTGDGSEFGRVPVPQLKPEFNLGAQVRNFGVDAQTNVVINAEVRDASNVLAFSASNNFGTVNSGDTINLDEYVTLPVLAEGVYTATFVVSSDQIANDGENANDTIVRAFSIDNLYYTLDGLGVHLGDETITALGTASFTDNTDGVFCLTYYPIRTAVDVYAIDALITTGTQAGAMVNVSLHDSATVVGDDVNSPLVESDDYTVTPADVANGFVRVLFNGAYNLQPGSYYAAIQLFSNNNTNDISILDDETVPQPALASNVYLPNVTTPGTYSNGNAFAVQLVLDPTASIAERGELAGVSMFPNPTTDLLTVTVDRTNAVNVDVINALGEVVSTGRFVGRTTIDMTPFAKGVYTVRVTDGKASSTTLVARN